MFTWVYKAVTRIVILEYRNCYACYYVWAMFDWETIYLGDSGHLVSIRPPQVKRSMLSVLLVSKKDKALWAESLGKYVSKLISVAPILSHHQTCVEELHSPNSSSKDHIHRTSAAALANTLYSDSILDLETV